MNRYDSHKPAHRASSLYDGVGRIVENQGFERATFFPFIQHPRLVIVGSDYLRINDWVIPRGGINKGSLENLKSSFVAWAKSPELPNSDIIIDAIIDQLESWHGLG